MQDPKICHLGTIAQLCRAISSHLRHVSTIWKNSSVSHTWPHNMVNFGPLAAEICWRVWGTPVNFNGFRVLAALLHCTLLVGVSQTLWHWTEVPPILGRVAITLGIGAHSSCVYFVLWYICFDRWMHAFVVLGLVFPYQAKRLAWGMSLKWPILCRVGHKTQSVSQCHSSDSIGCIGKVTLHWTWLVLGCLAIFVWAYHLSMQPATQANSASYHQQDGKWVPAKVQLGVKASMAHSTCGCTCQWLLKLCDPSFTRAIPEHLRDESYSV